MHPKIQLKAISRQELTVIDSFTTLGCMDEPEKHAFSARLNELCDEPQFGIPAAGKGRQVYLGKLFQVSQNAARKWLVGDGMPKPTTLERIARQFHVNTEWLRAGIGAKRQEEGLIVTDPDLIRLVQIGQSLSRQDRAAYIRMGSALAEPTTKENGQ
jgi:hypothetical protein